MIWELALNESNQLLIVLRFREADLTPIAFERALIPGVTNILFASTIPSITEESLRTNNTSNNAFSVVENPFIYSGSCICCSRTSVKFLTVVELPPPDFTEIGYLNLPLIPKKSARGSFIAEGKYTFLNPMFLQAHIPARISP